jgi:hypothetical protein
MAKKFNIHDWQAKQRKQLLKEAVGPIPLDDKKFYYIEDRKSNEVLHRGPLTAKSAAAEMEQYRNDNSVVAVANRYNKSLWLPGYTKGPREKNTEYPDSPNKLAVENIEEHHGDEDFPKLPKEVEKFLTRLKRANKKVYDQVEDIIRKQAEKNEASMTGTGASFNPGVGAGYATPKAFGDDKRKKRKGYTKGYKEMN